MTRSGIPPAFLSVKSGMPFRALNKESVLWINLLQGRLGLAGVSPETIVNSLLCIVLYRGWFNSYERWVAFEKEYDLKDGELLCNNFDVDRFVAAATSDAVEIEGQRRGGAYDPGTYGIGMGGVPEECLAERVVTVILPLLRARAFEFAKVVDSGVAASREFSMQFLLFVGLFLGPFVAYQVALDAGYLFLALFNEEMCIDVGPGAVSELSLLGGIGRDEGGMVRHRGEQLASISVCFELAAHLRNSEKSGYDCGGAVLLREVCRRFSLPLLGPQDCEYWGCELRQVDDRLEETIRRNPDRRASSQYITALEASFFRRFFVPPVFFRL